MHDKLISKKRNTLNDWMKLAKSIILRYIDTENYKVFLYGSRATKKYSHSSDIDIGILGNKPVEKRVLNKIKNELEKSNIPYHIDIKDFFGVDEKFKETALKEMIIWNDQTYLIKN